MLVGSSCVALIYWTNETGSGLLLQSVPKWNFTTRVGFTDQWTQSGWFWLHPQTGAVRRTELSRAESSLCTLARFLTRTNSSLDPLLLQHN